METFVETDEPLVETVPGPIVREQVERHWLGVPARFALLCLGCAAVGAAIGLFVASAWGWGVAALLVAFIAFGALREAVNHKGRLLPEQSVRFASDGREQAVSAAQVLRTRVETSFATWRTRSQLEAVEAARGPALQALGAAVRAGDRRAAAEASQHLDELDELEQSLTAELERRAEQANERIKAARLPVQETLMITPEEPNAPYPPPDEGQPPAPAVVPEPYPPPDEGTPPLPAPDPDPTDA
jgi:hypothetical protein